MLRRVVVGDNQRVFLIRKGRFEDVLVPGDYWIVGLGVRLERHDMKGLALVSDWTDFLVRERWELVCRHFTLVETRDSEVAVVYFDETVARVVGPGQRVLFWRGRREVTYDVIDAQSNPQVPAMLTPAIERLGGDSQAVVVVVEAGKRGLLYRNGHLDRELEPGTFAFWKGEVSSAYRKPPPTDV